MKPFNLEHALCGKPIVRRSGVKILRIVDFPEATAYNRVVVVDETRELTTHGVKGEYLDSAESVYDLFMAEEEMWVIVNNEGFSQVFDSKEKAVEYAKTWDVRGERTKGIYKLIEA